MNKSEDLILTIIDLIHRIRIKTIAEGVESEHQLRMLRNYECDFYQGYFLSAPVSEIKACELLEKFSQRNVHSSFK